MDTGKITSHTRRNTETLPELPVQLLPISPTYSVSEEHQLEIIRALANIHEPCQRHLETAVNEAVEDLQYKLDDLLSKTEGFLRWNLTEEGKSEEGNYHTGASLLLSSNGLYLSPTCKKHLILNYQKNAGEEPIPIDTYYDCSETICDFIPASYSGSYSDSCSEDGEDGEDGGKGGGDKEYIKIICRSSSILKKFTDWSEENKYVPRNGDWGFIHQFNKQTIGVKSKPKSDTSDQVVAP